MKIHHVIPDVDIAVFAEVEDDYPNNVETEGGVQVGGSVTGAIEVSGDADAFAVTLKGGVTYRFDLEGADTNQGTLSDPLLWGIFDIQGDRVSALSDDDGVGLNGRLFFTPEADGRYFISAAGFLGDTGTYKLSVTLETSADEAENVETGGFADVGGFVSGAIQGSHDEDWFAVTLRAGVTYAIDLLGAETNDGVLDDPVLRGIHDADGNQIENTTNDDGGVGFNSRLFFTPDTDGTYYISAGGFLGETGTYRLWVESDEDDYGESVQTMGRVDIGGSATGQNENVADADWFSVRLEANETYRIELEGSSTGRGTLKDPRILGIYDARGSAIVDTADDNSGAWFNSRLFLTPETEGTYYISAGRGELYGAGNYTLSVLIHEDDFPANSDTDGRVEVGGSATGEIEFGFDHDWFAVNLLAGQSYHIDLEGAETSQGTLKNTGLESVYDAEGNRMPDTRDSGIGQNSGVSFTPEMDGTYYISVTGSRADTGTYRLSVQTDDRDDTATDGMDDSAAEVDLGGAGSGGTGDAGTDDYPASADTEGTVEAGGSVTGEIEADGDRDWFAVTLTAGQSYRIDLEGAATGRGTLKDPQLVSVYDAEGIRIVDTRNDDGGIGLNSRVSFTPDVDGTYYISAGEVFGATGTYTLSVTAIKDKDDYAANTDTEGRVEVGGSVTGEIEIRYDTDWFAVTLRGGQPYRIDLEGADSEMGTLQNLVLSGIYDGDGRYISGSYKSSGGKGSNVQFIFTPQTDGTYYLSADATFEEIGTYTLSVSEHSDDFLESRETTGVVEVGGSVTGEIEWDGDRDWFAVTLKAGVSYRIDLEGADTDEGTLEDPYLRGIYDADGSYIFLTRNFDGGIGDNSRVLFTPETDGTYYVSASAVFGDTGTYVLSVTESADDFLASTGTDGEVEVGGSVTGEIEQDGDRDWFAVTLKAGVSYRIDLEGSATNKGTLRDPLLEGIYDAEVNRIAGTLDDDDGEGLNSQLIFTPETDGTYYVSAGETFGETGTYTLSVTEISDDYQASTDTDGEVEVGGSVTGEIEQDGDRDWFAVTLKAGVSYRIDLEGSATNKGTLRDPLLEGIYDADGNLIAGTRDDDDGEGLNSQLIFTPETDGTYYVSAGEIGGALGTYTLSVSEHGGQGSTAYAGDVQAVESGEINAEVAAEPIVRQDSAIDTGGLPRFEDSQYRPSEVWDFAHSAVPLGRVELGVIDDPLDQFVLFLDVGAEGS